MTTAIDISQHAGMIMPQQFRTAKEEGCQRVIVALNNMSLAESQIVRARDAGLEVEVYIYYYFGHNVVLRTRDKLGYLRDKGLLNAVGRVWMDLEDQTHTIEERYLVNRVRIARDTITGEFNKDVGIYTAAWWWNRYLPNTTEFSDLPLWDARWDNDPDIDPVRYGGWTKPYMSQYAADTHYGTSGIWCDINSYGEVAAPPPPVEPSPPSSVLTNAKNAAHYIDLVIKGLEK